MKPEFIVEFFLNSAESKSLEGSRVISYGKDRCTKRGKMNWINAKDRLLENQDFFLAMKLLIDQRKRLVKLPIDDIPKPPVDNGLCIVCKKPVSNPDGDTEMIHIGCDK